MNLSQKRNTCKSRYNADSRATLIVRVPTYVLCTNDRIIPFSIGVARSYFRLYYSLIVMDMKRALGKHETQTGMSGGRSFYLVAKNGTFVQCLFFQRSFFRRRKQTLCECLKDGQNILQRYVICYAECNVSAILVRLRNICIQSDVKLCLFALLY